jgi:hypothetical protein
MSKARERSGITPAGVTDQPAFAIKVNGAVVNVDPKTLTMIERRKVRAALRAAGALDDDMEALCATIWVVMLRDDPSLEYDDVAGALSMGDLLGMDIGATPDGSDPN